MARPEPPDPGLPIKLGVCGNGEFVPPPQTALQREVIERSELAVDRTAQRLGMSRRDFLKTSMAAATVLGVLGACSRRAGQRGGEFAIDSTTTTSGATTSTASSLVDAAPGSTAPEATVDPDAADQVVGPLDEEFIFDVQGHLLEFGDSVPGGAPGFPQAGCGEADARDCFSIEHFLEAIFLESDTHMVMLSAIPFAPGALSPEVMERTMAAADSLGCQDRVVMQGESFPTSVGIDAMAEVAASFPIRAFKTYTHTAGSPWRLDDEVGQRYLAHAETLGVPIVAVHKGLSGEDPAASPADVGPAATNHPGVSILVYHSGYESSRVEAEYSASSPSGADRLIASLDAAGVGQGSNVYAELGSTWRTLMGRPDEAAHLIGKLLLAVGDDNVLWGTDSIWYGSPQDQIQAFRAFRISEEFQERFGYRALTDEVKRKILGHNAARLFGVEPVTEPCRFSRDDLASLRIESVSTHHTHADAATRTLLATGGRPRPVDSVTGRRSA